MEESSKKMCEKIEKIEKIERALKSGGRVCGGGPGLVVFVPRPVRHATCDMRHATCDMLGDVLVGYVRLVGIF